MVALINWLVTLAIFAIVIIGFYIFARCEGGTSKWEHVGEVVGGIIIILSILAIIFL